MPLELMDHIAERVNGPAPKGPVVDEILLKFEENLHPCGPDWYPFTMKGTVSSPAAFNVQNIPVLNNDPEDARAAAAQLIRTSMRVLTDDRVSTAGEVIRCYLMFRLDGSKIVATDESNFIIMAASASPWTADVVAAMLKRLSPDLTQLADATRSMKYSNLTIIGKNDAVTALHVMAMPNRGSIAVIGNMLTSAHGRTYDKALRDAPEEFSGVLNFALFRNYGNSIGKLFDLTEQAETKMNLRSGVQTGSYRLFGHLTLPPPGGLRAVFPANTPQDIIPADFPLNLTAAEVGDEVILGKWLNTLAYIRLCTKFPSGVDTTPFDDMTEPFLSGVGVVAVNEVLLEEVLHFKGIAEKCAEQLADMLIGFQKLGQEKEHADLALRNATVNSERLSLQLLTEQARVENLKAQLAEKALLPGTDAEAQALLNMYEVDLTTRTGELEAARTKCEQLEAKITGLEAGLAARREPDKPDRKCPETWSQLAAAAQAAFPHIEFPDFAAEPAIAAYGRAGRTSIELQRTWSTLIEMDDYAAQRSRGLVACSFLDFLRRKKRPLITPTTVRLRESPVVCDHPGLRGQRLFLSTEGIRFCEAHVAVGNQSTAATRLHYDWLEEAGRVFVGYVGPHLLEKTDV